MFNKISAKLFSKYYIVGIGDINDIDVFSNKCLENVHWIKYKHYKKNWIADPFILSVDDNHIEILVEEWAFKDSKGRIVKYVIDRSSWKVVKKYILLELNTHLSFPIIYRENGVVYVYPENYQSGGLSIYKYNAELEKLEYIKELIAEPLLDTVIEKIDGKYYAFGIMHYSKDSRGPSCLMVYKSDTLLGPYNLIQQIESKYPNERGAGSILRVGNNIIRPAQCSEGWYGRNVIYYNLEKCNDVFVEKKIGSLNPHRSCITGLHTYNEFKDIYIVDNDCFIYGNIVGYLWNILRKIF